MATRSQTEKASMMDQPNFSKFINFCPILSIENDLLVPDVCNVLLTTKIFLLLKRSKRKMLFPSVLFTRKVMHKSSHQRCSVRKSVLRNLAKFTGKDLRQSLFLNKVAVLKPATLLKKRLWSRCFPVNFAIF